MSILRCNIRDVEPTTSSLKRNDYHLHTPLFVLDVIRLFQDHPKYIGGLKESHIVGLLEKEDIATGDVEAQVRMALKELMSIGFVRFVSQGYRTLGPFAKLALARTPHQQNVAWERLNKMQKINCMNFGSSFSMRSCS
ncbi:hypothetical protein FF38_08212 [Lucilia cuprina]|uniref:Uncharacterized protein n=1 Tax=Lucilia cuprina TaxID=7375 RepID=A0A0L0CI78_LUCCU|nr:hypothetical protein FF38_08212 [Lucilia cuprina]